MSGRYLRQSSICAASWHSSSTDHGWYPTVWIRIFGFWQMDTRLLSDKDDKTWCPQMRVCNFSSSGGNDFGRNPSGDNSCVSSLSDVFISDCKFAVFIHVLCTKGSSFWYNINPLSCHGIALNYTITRNGDFDKSAIPWNSCTFNCICNVISIHSMS